MSSLDAFLAKASKFVQDNSPSILTGIAVTGTLATAVLAGKASFRAAEVIRNDEKRLSKERTGEYVGHRLDSKDRFKLVWTLYIPSATTAGLTVAAIIGVNKIGIRRAAAMAAAFQTSERLRVEYMDKVRERLGTDKEEKLRDELAQDRVNRHPVGSTEVIITGGGDSLCYDNYSGRYFRSSIETIKKAQNDLNYQVLNHGDVALSDFYNKLGLTSIKYGNDVGWTSMDLLDIRFSSTLAEEQQPAIVIDFDVVPIRNYGGS